MTQLIEDWIDRLQEEKSPAYGRGFKPSFSVKNVFTTCERPAQHFCSERDARTPMSMLAGWVILILTWIPNLKSHSNFTYLLLHITI